MFRLTLLFFTIYIVGLTLLLIVGFILQILKEKKALQKGSVILEDITLVIPFRNEENRVSVLVESLNSSEKLPGKIIFIDDHSIDNSVKVIQSSLKVNYQLIRLPLNVTGKKMAIREAINSTNTKYIHTMDADVCFHSTFFSSIEYLKEQDLFVFPVVMKAKRLMGHLFEIDYLLVNAVNVGLAGLKRPIMASGANLLFKREDFLKNDSIERHKHIASGDDMYTLRDFREANKDIQLVSSPKYAMTTEVPQSLNEFINQRLRWLGKTIDLKDYLSTFLSFFQGLITFVFIGLLVYWGIVENWCFLTFTFVVKAVIDLIVFAPYFLRLKRIGAWLTIPLYEVIFPFYTLLMLVLLLVYKPIWKGRNISSK